MGKTNNFKKSMAAKFSFPHLQKTISTLILILNDFFFKKKRSAMIIKNNKM